MSNEVDLRKHRKVEANVTVTGVATEATLIEVRDYLDTVELKLADIITNTTGVSLEATQIQVRDYLDTVEAKLASLIINTTGLSLEATQLLVKANTDKIDVLLSTRTSEATLATMLTLAGFQARINTLGQKTAANSTPVVLASDNTLTITGDEKTFGSTQASTTVAANVASVLLKAANASRKELIIRNTSTKTLYVCFFTPATTATAYALAKDEILIEDRWQGAVYGIWATGATGTAEITQVTT